MLASIVNPPMTWRLKPALTVRTFRLTCILYLDVVELRPRSSLSCSSSYGEITVSLCLAAAFQSGLEQISLRWQLVAEKKH